MQIVTQYCLLASAGRRESKSSELFVRLVRFPMFASFVDMIDNFLFTSGHSNLTQIILAGYA